MDEDKSINKRVKSKTKNSKDTKDKKPKTSRLVFSSWFFNPDAYNE